jgi:hypothetical protein
VRSTKSPFSWQEEQPNSCTTSNRPDDEARKKEREKLPVIRTLENFLLFVKDLSCRKSSKSPSLQVTTAKSLVLERAFGTEKSTYSLNIVSYMFYLFFCIYILNSYEKEKSNNG